MKRLGAGTAYTAVVIATFSLIGCESVSKQGLGTVAGGAAGALLGSQFGSGTGQILAIIGGTVAGAWLGSELAAYLDEQDQQEAAEAVQTAAVTGEGQGWTNPDTGNSGTTEVAATNKTTDPVNVKVLKDRVEQVPPLTLDASGPHKVTANANVRGGPGTDYKVVGSLNAGDTVAVTGKVQNADWFLINKGGIGTGFVYANLLEAAPADKTLAAYDGDTPNSNEVAEITVLAERTCRTITHTVQLSDGATKQEEVTACSGPNGWEIKPAT